MENIGWLIDMRNIYQLCKTAPAKRELIRTVFDFSFYYKNRVHRTPYFIPKLAHNELIMKEKGLLIINKKGDFLTKIPSGGGEGSRTPVQTYSPKAFYMLIPALIVGRRQEPDTPIVTLAGCS